MSFQSVEDHLDSYQRKDNHRPLLVMADPETGSTDITLLFEGIREHKNRIS